MLATALERLDMVLSFPQIPLSLFLMVRGTTIALRSLIFCSIQLAQDTDQLYCYLPALLDLLRQVIAKRLFTA